MVRSVYAAMLLISSAVWTTASAATGETDPHWDLLSQDAYPRAAQCGVCHQKIYRQWSVSNHAYSSISPMFHKFEQKISELSSGTVGAFCVRCHQQIGTQLGEARESALWQRSGIAREGVTCITCHRVAEEYGKVNGARTVMPGGIHAPVKGSKENSSFDKVVADPEYPIATKDGEEGIPSHSEVQAFAQIKKSEFCVSCHQVAVHPNIKLEVVWDQYRASPAFDKGVTCQDCHMGKNPGVPDGYETGPVAIVNGKPVGNEREHHDHNFFGPGYSIAHPGIFPHNPEAERWTIDEWLQFDYRAQWGSEDFEVAMIDGDVKVDFPEAWADPVDREEAWLIIEDNLTLLEEKKEQRAQVMANGSKIDGPFFADAPTAGDSFDFYYEVSNINSGHNLPSGSLGAQPEIWLNVALTNPSGETVWESGYVDSYGDMADLHSMDVAAGKIEHDDQLFNLQTKFLTTNVKGTDREMPLPVNFDVDPLPQLRPGAVPTSVLNHPPFIRMEGRSLPPLGSRKAEYTVPASAMSEPGTYRLSVRLRSRAEPIYFMRFVEATIEMEQAMNEWMVDIHPYTVEIDVQ
ncbi:MAG: multiheme c-type cytochrome [Alphaproteobacteria bacterium]